MKIGFIYEWTNNINGKKYVGSHIGHLSDGYTGSGRHFKNAVKKYGIENFTRLILEFVDDISIIYARETYYLKLLDVANDKEFYNIVDVAGAGWSYINSNADCRKRSKESGKDRWSRFPHPQGMKGKKHTSKHRAVMKAATLESNRKRQVAILKFDLNGNFIEEFESLKLAAESVKGSCSNIKYHIEGHFKTAYKYIWKYKDPEYKTQEFKCSNTRIGRSSCKTQLEYKGKTYNGWDELYKETKIGSYLYKKYYEKGIDPEPFINNPSHAWVKKAKENNNRNSLGKKWFNNGIKESYFLEADVPETWVKGRLKKVFDGAGEVNTDEELCDGCII